MNNIHWTTFVALGLSLATFTFTILFPLRGMLDRHALRTRCREAIRVAEARTVGSLTVTKTLAGNKFNHGQPYRQAAARLYARLYLLAPWPLRHRFLTAMKLTLGDDMIEVDHFVISHMDVVVDLSEGRRTKIQNDIDSATLARLASDAEQYLVAESWTQRHLAGKRLRRTLQSE